MQWNNKNRNRSKEKSADMHLFMLCIGNKGNEKFKCKLGCKRQNNLSQNLSVLMQFWLKPRN